MPGMEKRMKKKLPFQNQSVNKKSGRMVGDVKDRILMLMGN